MATTTPNYGWDVPTSTDYVKDGAVAIETLGDDIDASLYSITSGKNVGLVHINTTTATASSGGVAIDNVFTTDFDNYLIIATYNGSQDSALQMRLRVGGVPDTGASSYLTQKFTSTGATNTGAQTATSSFEIQGSRTTPSSVELTVLRPRLTVPTHVLYHEWDNSGILAIGSARHSASTAYDGFQFIVTGTFTATIRVYGYRNA